VQQNDILIAWLVCDSAAVPNTQPSGWSLIGGPVDNTGTADVRGVAYWKRAGAGEAGPYSFTWVAAAVGAMLMGCYSGALTSGNPIDDSVVNGTAAGSSHTSSSIVTSVNDCLLVCMAGADESGTFTPYWSAWANSAVEREDVQSAAFTEHGLADYVLATAGTTSFTVTAADSDGGVVGLVALMPAAGTTPVIPNLAMPRKIA
jgi:hypothetical protein